MALDALADRLALLLADGRLPYSVLGPFNRAKLQSLFDAGVLREQRVGGGRRIVVENRPALEAFVRSRYPSGLGSLVDAGAPPKSRAVAERRDAKLARRGDAEPVLLRGFGDAVLRSGDDVLQVAEWTRRAGLAALRVDDPCPWGFEGTVAVVENLEVFLHLERIGVPCDIALYAAGRLSRRVLGWLGSPAMDRCGYIHCGDFDPMGLDEYLRLSEACCGRAQLLLPEDLEHYFATYGKRELLESNQAILARLRKKEDPAVQRVVHLMDLYGVGVEQEILLLGI